MALSREEVLDAIADMSVMDVVQLVEAMEEKFGVSAAAPVMVAGAVGGGGGDVEEEVKDSFDVVLTSAGEKKIQVIKVVREITSLGLKEAKALVDEAPKPVKEGVTKEEADEIQTKLSDAGGTVEIQ